MSLGQPAVTIEIVGLVCGIAMPFFNIPLIMRIVRRRSSADISLVWAAGVWACVVGMFPAALRSDDFVLRSFGAVNAVFFSGVFAAILWFHPAVRRKSPGPSNGSPSGGGSDR